MRPKLELTKKTRTGFLSRFSLASRQLKAADRARGVPSLRLGTDGAGTQFLIKTWPRSASVDDADLREIWRNETRQLYRIAGNRGVGDYIAQLAEATYDEHGFYLVIDVGQRVPLATLLETNGGLRYAHRRTVVGRRLLWANFLRIAKGLDLLHLQGMLHRNLGVWSILTADESEPDFQLTGFEWSMRIVGVDGRLRPLANKPTDRHSFLRDWLGLGQLMMHLLEINPSRAVDVAIPSHEVAEHLTAAESRLVRQLLQVIPSARLDGKEVIPAIEKVLLALDATIQNEELVYHLVLHLGRTNQLVDAIREASDFDIETDDERAQLAFVEADLANPTVLLMRDDRYALRGELLTYLLTDFRRTRDRIPSNWEVAYCHAASVTRQSTANPLNSLSLVSNAIAISPLSQTSTMFRGRSRGTPWTTLHAQLKPGKQLDVRERRLQWALALTQMVDYAFAATDVFPVSVESVSDGSDGEGRHKIRVTARAEDRRERLSAALELKDPPAKRLEDSLIGDRESDDRRTNWVLSPSATLGERADRNTEWQFVSDELRAGGQKAYLFVGETPPPDLAELYLIPGDSAGRDSQLERRLKSLAALADHQELTRMLIDPRRRIHDSNEVVIKDQGFLSLDKSKQDAFTAIIETLPLFLVQGPPGVGKTRLVRELVRQVLQSDKTTRILLSAQSNHAVDHLMSEIVGSMSPSELADSVVIRCSTADRKDAESRFDIGAQAKHLLRSVLGSSLYKTASPGVRAKADALGELYGLRPEAIQQPSSSNARRAFEGLLLRSANLLFATANSGDIQTLIEDRGQFDWTIVEEAGKATGGELLAPLLLSPRRLMIGDHLQLPPFGEERVLRLLGQPMAVKRSLDLVSGMIGKSFRDSTVDEVFSEIKGVEDELDQNELAKLCEDAARSFILFSSMITSEYRRIERGGTGRAIAAALTRQHRMHPVIADLVSSSFYGGDLKTDESAAERFELTPPVRWRSGVKIPNAPIVWVDMPWVQDTKNMKRGESWPRFTNINEVASVLRVLELTETHKEKSPSMAVLSPYARQVRKLSQELARSASSIHLDEFTFAAGHKTFCNTVDSFQGSEADMVIVSLVRNNGYGAVRAALGFLADARRMNVLMSRARWRLVVVGSLAFLKSVVESPKNSGQDEAAFLGRIIGFIEKNEGNGVVCVTPAELGLPK